MGLFQHFKVCRVSHDDSLVGGGMKNAVVSDGKCRSGGWCSEKRGEGESLVWDVHR